MIGAFVWLIPLNIDVKNVDELVAAAKVAKPGQHIRLASGNYPGGIHLTNLHGAPGQVITIEARDPANRPKIVGGGSGLQLSKVSYLAIDKLVITEAKDNGLNIDDGGSITSPSHHISLHNIDVSDLPAGNHDGIKLSGIKSFRILNCTVQRWGGSGIDMVGCHDGEIEFSVFKDGGSNGVQMKGGTSKIRVSQCRFENPGERGVNLGGSTGIPYFRPALDTILAGARSEAKNLTVDRNTFVGSAAPIAFVGVDGAVVTHNTIVYPKRWAIRILQETATPDFVPCRNGIIEDNLFVFESDSWSSGGVNIGPGTEPKSFRFARNAWFCQDKPFNSRPTLPVPETKGVYGVDPLLIDPSKGDYGVREGSPLRNVGAHALKGKS